VGLNNIADRPGAVRQGRRLGRGIGSSKGKTAGGGHKGQRSRGAGKPKLGFEGGQTPLRLRLPKRGFHNRQALPPLAELNLDKLGAALAAGRLDAGALVTMKSLRDAGLVPKTLKGGVKLLGGGAGAFSAPVDLEVSRASRSAKAAVEAAGGSVREVWYNRLGLRALLKPEALARPVRPARLPPRLARLYDGAGRLPAPAQPLAGPRAAAVPGGAP